MALQDGATTVTGWNSSQQLPGADCCIFRNFESQVVLPTVGYLYQAKRQILKIRVPSPQESPLLNIYLPSTHGEGDTSPCAYPPVLVRVP